MQVCAKLAQPVAIPPHDIADALALQQIGKRRILDGAERAVAGNASAQDPIGDAGLKLFRSIPSDGAGFLQRLQPRQFGLGALQCLALDDNLRRKLRQAETTLTLASDQVGDPLLAVGLLDRNLMLSKGGT